METKSISIKNMVCDRCIMSVEALLISSGYVPISVKLGQAIFSDPGTGMGMPILAQRLKDIGFEIIQKPGEIIVQLIKDIIRDLVRSGKLEHMHLNMSAYLEQEMAKDYSTLTHLFGTYETMSLERFTIMQKIEQAKEWLHEEQMSMSEIAIRLGYSSAAYFSNQFRQITGLTPSAYKSQKPNDRLRLDKLTD